MDLVHVQIPHSLFFRSLIELVKVFIDNAHKLIEPFTSRYLKLLYLVFLPRVQLQVAFARVHNVGLNVQIEVVKVVFLVRNQV